MPNMTIYIREDDMPIYEQAKKLDQKISLSQVLTQSLKEYIQRKEEGGFLTITIEIGNELTLSNGGTFGSYRKIRFTGRLLAVNVSPTRDKLAYDMVFDWYIYKSINGGWLVLREKWYKNDGIDFSYNPLFFDREYWTAKSLEELKELKDPENNEKALIPSKLFEQIQEDRDFVEDLDI